MATATKKLKPVPPPPPPPMETEVTLTLTNEEAQFLTDVLASVGGDSTKTRRKYQDSISEALYKIDYHFTGINDAQRDWAGNIMFHATNAEAVRAMKYKGLL